jgi:hypothetical protein
MLGSLFKPGDEGGVIRGRAVDFHRITKRVVPEGTTIRHHGCENLKHSSN